jgi:hypothetical protein
MIDLLPNAEFGLELTFTGGTTAIATNLTRLLVVVFDVCFLGFGKVDGGDFDVVLSAISCMRTNEKSMLRVIGLWGTIKNQSCREL